MENTVSWTRLFNNQAHLLCDSGIMPPMKLLKNVLLARQIVKLESNLTESSGSEGNKRKSRVSSKKTFRTRSAEQTLLIATDRMDLSAELIGLIYRYRWQIELFFRWFKCILGCQHLLALS